MYTYNVHTVTWRWTSNINWVLGGEGGRRRLKFWQRLLSPCLSVMCNCSSCWCWWKSNLILHQDDLRTLPCRAGRCCVKNRLYIAIWDVIKLVCSVGKTKVLCRKQLDEYVYEWTGQRLCRSMSSVHDVERYQTVRTLCGRTCSAFASSAVTDYIRWMTDWCTAIKLLPHTGPTDAILTTLRLPVEPRNGS